MKRTQTSCSSDKGNESAKNIVNLCIFLGFTGLLLNFSSGFYESLNCGGAFIALIFLGLFSPLWIIPVCKKLPCFKEDLKDDLSWRLLVFIIYVTTLLYLLNLSLSVNFDSSELFAKGFEQHLSTLISVLYGSFISRYLVPLFKIIEMNKPNTSQEINKQ
ncbi:hypothetical protein ACIO08_10550 [Avibacterium paragallinarum]|uniref:hypothetical protein n=1 Tax=Avibacterium paragallinarum TaxID=728 RepID=UPI0039798385